jgi:cytochrome c peroxidase
MNRVVILLVVIILAGISACTKDKSMYPEVRFEQPSHFPETQYKFENNEITGAGFALGRKLFYDGQLSRDGSISCGFCHQQAAAFTHPGQSLSPGIDNQLGTRNAQPIMNLAWHPNFFWDGGVFDLDGLSIAPIHNPAEMDESIPNVLRKLRQDPEYPPMFEAAFGDEEITTARFLKALSQFMLMCVSADAPYDHYVQGDEAALTPEQQLGLALVEEKCGSCHSGVLFSDFGFHNNGLSHTYSEDTGRYRISLKEEDKYKFKTPSLRNLGYSAPYMHDGRFKTIDEVLDHYTDGVIESPTLAPELQRPGQAPGITLSPTERQQIKAFLDALNDESFISNRELAEF